MSPGSCESTEEEYKDTLMKEKFGLMHGEEEIKQRFILSLSAICKVTILFSDCIQKAKWKHCMQSKMSSYINLNVAN